MALDPGKKKVYKKKTGATYDGRSRMNKRKRGSGGPTGKISGYGQLHPSKTEGFGPVYTEEGTKRANMKLPGEPTTPQPWSVPSTSGTKHQTLLVKSKSKSKRKSGGKGWQII